MNKFRGNNRDIEGDGECGRETNIENKQIIIDSKMLDHRNSVSLLMIFSIDPATNKKHRNWFLLGVQAMDNNKNRRIY